MLKIRVVLSRALVDSPNIREIPDVRRYSMWPAIFNPIIHIGSSVLTANVKLVKSLIASITKGRWDKDTRNQQQSGWESDDRKSASQQWTTPKTSSKQQWDKDGRD